MSTLLAAPLFLFAQESAENLDIEYAEIKPLATDSLLLDITRTSSGRLVAVGERGHVIFSDDGQSWRQAEVVPTRSTLTTVTSTGGRLWAAGHDTVIITSGDDGLTWTRQYFDPERMQAIMDLHFVDKNNGVAMGAYGLFLETDDGGETWIDGSVDYENEFHLNDMIRFEDGRRMIAGEAGYSYRSYDDGQTWEALELPYLGSMWGAERVDSDCVIFFGLRGHILQSCDFGDTWSDIDAGTLTSLSAAASDDDSTVIAGNSGVVLVRDASGEFENHVHSSGVDFASVISLGGGRYMLVGEDGVHAFPETGGEGQGESAP